MAKEISVSPFFGENTSGEEKKAILKSEYFRDFYQR
jgi:hypothetical protein